MILKAFYAAWLREIELGKRSWSDDPQQIETAILTKHIRPQKNSESDISKTERNGRINLLKKIVYYSSTYDFKGLKAFYAAWLREIELGKCSWSDDPQQIETAILAKHIRPQKNSQPVSKKDSSKSSSDKEKVWFCSMYQRNKCPHKNGHMAVFKGEAKLCQHICATCWLKDKTKLTHPECSSSYPHASA